MRKLIVSTAVLAFLGTTATAQAGCVSGAIVGGIAGHMAGHGKVGAAAGCAIGHHDAKKKDAQQQGQQPPKQ